MTFDVLGVNKDIVAALRDEGIVNPTLIQEKAIPLIKQGYDVIGMSKTGSGKTAAFAVPILESVVPHGGLQVLVLSPTRELAIQISKEFKKFGKYVHCDVTTVYGGVGYDPQIMGMRKSEIVVGTTGRLCDHLRQGNIDLSKLKCIVLDEADKMVEMGFIEDIHAILQKTPGDRQVLLFGATISHEIDRLKRDHMKDPKVARAEANVQEEYLEQFYYNVEHNQKFSLLVNLLNTEEIKRAIVFCSARTTCEMVAKNLSIQKIENEMLHGKLSQNKREQVLNKFNEGNVQILVASAVAARGLDIRDVSHIFNYDLSQDPQEYIHRIGRTARAGETGKAITLLCHRDHDTFRQIQDRYPVNVEVLEKKDFPKVKFQTMSSQHPRRGGQGGPRRSFRGRPGQGSRRPRR